MKKAYRGYLICHNQLNGSWWVEKDGQLIGWAENEADAKAKVDYVTEGQ